MRGSTFNGCDIDALLLDVETRFLPNDLLSVVGPTEISPE